MLNLERIIYVDPFPTNLSHAFIVFHCDAD